MFRDGAHEPYQAVLSRIIDRIGATYMFGGNNIHILDRYVYHSVNGSLIDPWDVPPDRFLSTFTLIPADRIPSGFDPLALGAASAKRRDDGSWLINIWPDHTMTDGTAYSQTCKALGLHSVFKIPPFIKD